MTVSMGAMGAFFTITETYPHFDMTSLFWLPVASLMMYNLGVGIGFRTIPHCLACELFPLKTRGITCGITFAICSLLYFIISKYLFALLMFVQESNVYWGMSCASALGIMCVLVTVPETQRKSLEQIEDDFKK